MARKDTQTARKGNPRQASRGAAVARVKAALGDLIDALLSAARRETSHENEMKLLRQVGGPAAERRLKVATLDELQRWAEGVRRISASRARSIVDARVRRKRAA